MIPFMGFFNCEVDKKDGVNKAYPVQTKWVWTKRKNDNGSVSEVGVEVESHKKGRPLEDFFRVFEELTYHEYNLIWGKYLERL